MGVVVEEKERETDQSTKMSGFHYTACSFVKSQNIRNALFKYPVTFGGEWIHVCI